MLLFSTLKTMPTDALVTSRQGINRHGIEPQSQYIPSPASEKLISNKASYGKVP